MRIPISLSIAISSLILTSCGNDLDPPVPEPLPEPVDYSQLNLTPQTEQPLVLADEARLSQHLKNGIRLQLGGQFLGGSRDGSSAGGTPPPSAAPPTSEASGDSLAPGGGAGFSDTNVHVQGVDEADYAKYDGQHWYIATYPQFQRYLPSPIAPGVQIAATDPAAPNAEIVGQFTMDEDWGSVGEMYLVQQDGSTSHLAALRNQWGSVRPMLPGIGLFGMEGGGGNDGGAIATPRPAEGAMRSSIAIDTGFWPSPVNSGVRLQLINVQEPSDPQQDWDLHIDGALIDSRKIGNTLYLITRFDPWLAELDYAYGDERTMRNNEVRISGSEISQLLPKYRIGDGDAQPLTTSCYLQENVEDHHGFASLVHITAVDLAGQSIINSRCLNSGVESLSMSTESLYLTGTVYDYSSYQQKTVIHKFDLTENGAEYAATGSVSGGLGWRSDPAFRLHEHQGDLRVVTSQWNMNDIEHRLFILEQDGNRLRTVAQLPNDAQPDAIGKPGEDIYSVRFQGDRAYIVTFLQYDPLYSIDLSDRLNPRVTGELEVPGFATYMHPVGEDYLFTLGNDAREDGLPLGIKAELIDISGDAPTVINTIILGGRGTQSEATYNLRALSFLPVGDNELRIVLPISLFESASEGSWGEWQYTGLQLLEIQGIAEGEARLSDAGTMIAERGGSSSYPTHGIHRGILHDDAVFYTHNNAIWAAHWHSPEDAVGPITAEPIACTTEYVYGLEVHVHLATQNSAEVDACDVLVTATDGDYQEILTSYIPLDSPDGGCQFFGAGERPGSYVVESSLPGFTSNAQKVNVGADLCHVIPERIKLQLYEDGLVNCTDVLTPSLVVDLQLADRGEGACAAEVVAVQDGQRYPLEAMVPPPSPDDPDVADSHCQFSGPHELPGHMTLEVSLPGYAKQQVEDIFVPHGVCHVATQHLRLELAPF